MAFFTHNHILPFLTLIFLCLPICQSSSSSIHDLLNSMGLPAGLLPKEVKSYKYSGSGLLEVSLYGPCLTKFETMALYESEVRANLTYGSMTGVEELFVWLPVKDIIVDDPTSGVILIDIGLAHKQLSLSLFEDPPHCTTKSGLKGLICCSKIKLKKKTKCHLSFRNLDLQQLGYN